MAGLPIIEDLSNGEVRVMDRSSGLKAPFIIYRYERRSSALVPHPTAFVEWGCTYENAVNIGLVATSYECLEHIEWYGLRGAGGVLAEEVKQPWRLLEREFGLDELTSQSSSVACFPFSSQEHFDRHKHEVAQRVLEAVARSVSHEICKWHEGIRPAFHDHSTHASLSTSSPSRVPLVGGDNRQIADSPSSHIVSDSTSRTCSVPHAIPNNV